jgi:hypothetical protein
MTNLVNLRKRADALKEKGYKLESNQDGYKVYFEDKFIHGASVKLPREKRLHWKHARKCP